MELLGSRIRIRQTCEDDLPFLRALWAEPEVMRHVGHPHGMTVDDAALARWWAMTPQGHDPEARLTFADAPHCVIERLDGTRVGELSYTIDAAHRARVDLKLDPACAGQGLAAEAMGMVLRELFAATPTERVIVEPSADNARALDLLRRTGFVPTPTENHPDRWSCTRESFAEAV
jgi:RimJ/RimL family protein N-acetyltransferase